MDANNIRFVAVGLEELGVDEFVQGQFFNGELYIDTKKQAYKELGYKRIGLFSAVGSIVSGQGRAVLAEAKKENISGNMKGDGYQNGGTLIVSKGGSKVLLNYVQEHPAEHVALADVLKALGISASVPNNSEATSSVNTNTASGQNTKL